MQFVPDSFAKVEPPFSANERKYDAWEPEWIEFRFNFTVICNLDRCGEVSHINGNGSVDQTYDYEGSFEWYEYFSIRSAFPSPHLMTIPEQTPAKVVQMLERSFQLFWPNPSSAAGALRSSLEFLLDDLKIPREQKDRNGAVQRLSLHRRIELVIEQQKEFSDLFLALKEVGNIGSHGGDVTDKQYSDSLEIFDYVLHDLYKNDAARIKKLAQDLLAGAKGETGVI